MASFANVDVTKINGAGVLAYESSDLAKTLGDAIAAKDAADANSALETVKAPVILRSAPFLPGKTALYL